MKQKYKFIYKLFIQYFSHRNLLLKKHSVSIEVLLNLDLIFVTSFPEDENVRSDSTLVL